MNAQSEYKMIERMTAGDFNPDQPRDENGRWTSTGATGSWKPDDIYLEKGWVGHRYIENQAEEFLETHLPDADEELDQIWESRVVSKPTKSGIADVEVDYSVITAKGKREERTSTLQLKVLSSVPILSSVSK